MEDDFVCVPPSSIIHHPSSWGRVFEAGLVIPLNNFLVLSTILFSLGIYGVLARRSAVLILMSVELMLQAVSINFIAFAVYLSPQQFTGIIFSVFVITIAA